MEMKEPTLKNEAPSVTPSKEDVVNAVDATSYASVSYFSS
jgi:hypothetical protein